MQSRVEQGSLFRRGGKRRGAGRKPKGEKALVAHSSREHCTEREPVLVTMRFVGGLASLRTPPMRQRILDALELANERFGVRVAHGSIQSNHLQLIVEATSAADLARGMKGLLVRLARMLNRVAERSGPVFRDRFHSLVLRTPRAVRNALVYVLNNARKHGIGHVRHCDPYSSGETFDGWREAGIGRAPARRATLFDPADDSAVIRSDGPWRAPRSWLLAVGWRRHGLIGVHELPAS